jgi:hypothetical protein
VKRQATFYTVVPIQPTPASGRKLQGVEVIADERGRPVPGPVADVQVHVVDKNLAESHRHDLPVAK